jgi:Rrf2 family iron-sulfur cluster assembly transcriptional regulator
VVAVDESLDNTRCKGNEDCDNGERCLTHKLWNDLSERLYEFLDGITLSEFISQPEVRKISRRQDTTASRIANMFPPRSKAG